MPVRLIVAATARLQPGESNEVIVTHEVGGEQVTKPLLIHATQQSNGTTRVTVYEADNLQELEEFALRGYIEALREPSLDELFADDLIE